MLRGSGFAVVVLVFAVLAAGCGGDDEDSNVAWADDVCGSVSTWIESVRAAAQSVQGALCVYVLLGLMFAFFYGTVAVLGDGDFFAQGTDGDRSVRVYFSFVTLATVGYGDYTAAHDVGRTLAIVEGLSGQLYLVTVIALLVSRIGFRHPTRADSRASGASPQVDDATAGDRG